MMPSIAIDVKRCVGCGNCRIYLGDKLFNRFRKNVLGLTNEELNEFRGVIDNAIDKCYLDALKLLED